MELLYCFPIVMYKQFLQLFICESQESGVFINRKARSCNDNY